MNGDYSPQELGFEALTARSVALSALLGEHPPELSGRALVALGEVLGIAEGAMRTALSRLVRAGEVSAREGRYLLGDRLRQRQAAHDSGRDPVPQSWDGSWWVAAVDADRRPLSQRREFRAQMRLDRMGELRPDLWLRPANVEGPTAHEGVVVVRGTVADRDPAELVGRLWDLPVLADQAVTLVRLVKETHERLTAQADDVLRDASMLTVAVSRFLLREPRLPPALVGAAWPLERLRTAYDGFEVGYRAARAEVLGSA